MSTSDEQLHVLTACSRPQNLERIARSLAPFPVSWHIQFDLEREHVGGQALKNRMLDEVWRGWVLFLDDDTILHPELYEHIPFGSAADALVVSQLHSQLGILHAAPENVCVGSIDIGQVVCRRDIIGPHRIPTSYAGDGEFWTEILPSGNVVYLDRVLSYHNAIT